MSRVDDRPTQPLDAVPGRESRPVRDATRVLDRPPEPRRREVLGSLVWEGTAGEAVASSRLFVLEGERAIVGRSPRCEIQVPHPAVSREHLVFRRVRDEVVCEDLDSLNGTLVNGVEIAGPTALEPGDRIDVCGARFRWVPEEGAGCGQAGGGCRSRQIP